MLKTEEIEQNFSKYRSLLAKVGPRSQVALEIVDHLGARLAVCPASPKKDYHCSYSGGLVEHSLHVLQNLLTLSNSFNWKFNKHSMIISALFHDLGKVGYPDDGTFKDPDYYTFQTDEWRRNKLGETFKYNNEIQFMTVPDRSIFICQHFSLKLTVEEFLAIRTHDGLYASENEVYKMKEPLLATALHIADIISLKNEKQSEKDDKHDNKVINEHLEDLAMGKGNLG